MDDARFRLSIDVLGRAIRVMAIGVLVPWVKPVVAFASRTSDAPWRWAAGHRDGPPDPGAARDTG